MLSEIQNKQTIIQEQEYSSYTLSILEKRLLHKVWMRLLEIMTLKLGEAIGVTD